MSDIRILMTFPDTLELEAKDNIEIVQDEKSIYSGVFNKDLLVTITDITLEFHLIFKISEVISKISLYLLPLLISQSFKIRLFENPETKSFSITEFDTNKFIVVEFHKNTEISVSCLSKRQAKLYNESEVLGVQKNKLNIEGNPNYLNNLLLGLNSKLIQQEISQINNRSLENYLKSCEVNKKFIDNLQSEKPSSSRDPCTENNTLLNENQFSSLFDKNSELLKENQDLRLKVNTLESTVDSLKRENFSLQEQALSSSTHAAYIKDLLSQVQSLKHLIDVEESSKNQLKSELNSLIGDYDRLLLSVQSLESKNEDEFSLSKKDLEIFYLQQENQSLLSQISALSAELEPFRSWPEAVFQPTSGVPKATTQQDSSESSNHILSLKSKVDEQSLLLSELLQKLQNAQKKITELEEYSKSQDDIIKLISVNSQVSATYEKLAPDYSKELTKLNDQLDKIKEITTDLEYDFYYEALDHFKNIKELSEINLNLHRLFSKTVSLIYDKDCQIYMLRHIARDAQMQKSIYVPVKSDPIDVCMAEYVNNRKVPMQIPFIREDTGVYNFYTRTIKVKIENSKVIVRLGGGFQGVDDFVKTNTQAELDKLEERRKFGTAEAVKKLIESDFNILGLPAPIDHMTLVISNDSSYTSTANNSFVVDSITPRKIKKTSLTAKESSLKRKEVD